MIRDFLSATGLTQAVRGFDADIMVMNPGFEREVVPGALDDLLDSLVVSYACRLAAPVTYPLSYSCTGSDWGSSHNAHLSRDPSTSVSWSMCTCAPGQNLKRKGALRVSSKFIRYPLTLTRQPDDQGYITFPCEESCSQQRF